MKSPFPGMDPYLEWYWGDVHTRLTTYAGDQLAPQMPPDLRVRVEEYVAVDEENGEALGFYPDVRVEERAALGVTRPATSAAAMLDVAEPLVVPLRSERPTLRYLRIIDVRSGNRLVTAIEFLSLTNKKGRAGRAAYRKKRKEFKAAGVNLVEIDLLRAGQYVLLAPRGHVPAKYHGPYRACVYRACRPDSAEFYPLSLRARMRPIRIPLRETDPDARLDLQELIDKTYENGRYDDIDYSADPVPPLSSTDAKWADRLLREKGLR
jgi:hypothetical protein